MSNDIKSYIQVVIMIKIFNKDGEPRMILHNITDYTVDGNMLTYYFENEYQEHYVSLYVYDGEIITQTSAEEGGKVRTRFINLKEKEVNNGR